jgi:hypothetical protein
MTQSDSPNPRLLIKLRLVVVFCPSATGCPSFRHYVRAGELKAAGMVWTEVLELEEDNGAGNG